MAGYLIGGRLVAGGGRSAGEITVRAVPASGGSFELPLNSDGSLDVDVNLPMVDPLTGVSVDLAGILVPGRDYIAWVERTTPGDPDGDVILEGGPIWADPFTFPYRARIVANGLWSYFDHRYVMPVLAAGQLPRDVTSKWTGLSLRTIAKRLVQQACAHPSAGLPIDYEPDIAGTHEREYRGEDRKPVGEALRDITQVEGGPEITFRPKWTADRRGIRWDMVTGDPEITQAGQPHYWDVSVPDAHARIVSIERDGSELLSRDFEIGETIRNRAPDGEFRQGPGRWVAGGGGNALTAQPAGTTELALGVKGYGLIIWSASGVGGGIASGPSSITVEPGETLIVSVRANASTTKPVRLLARHYGESGQISEQQLAAGNVTSGPYVTFSGTATVPAGATRMEVLLYAQAGQTWSSGDRLRTTAWRVHEDVGTPLPYFYEELQMQARADNPALTDAHFPFLEGSTLRGSVSRPATLQEYANAAVQRGSGHIETWTISARRDKVPALGTYRPGDYAVINVGPNARVPAGRHQVRIVGFQFGGTGDVLVQCAPERVASGYPVPSSTRTWLRDKLRTLSQTVMETTRGK